MISLHGLLQPCQWNGDFRPSANARQVSGNKHRSRTALRFSTAWRPMLRWGHVFTTKTRELELRGDELSESTPNQSMTRRWDDSDDSCGFWPPVFSISDVAYRSAVQILQKAFAKQNHAAFPIGGVGWGSVTAVVERSNTPRVLGREPETTHDLRLFLMHSLAGTWIWWTDIKTVDPCFHFLHKGAQGSKKKTRGRFFF
jgi:hypothetical protein